MSLTLDQRRSLIKRIESITGLKPNKKAIQTDFDFFNYLVDLIVKDVSDLSSKAAGTAIINPDEVERETGRVLNGRKQYYKTFRFVYTASGNYSRAHNIDNLEHDDSNFPIILTNVTSYDWDGKGEVFEFDINDLSSSARIVDIDSTTINTVSSNTVIGGGTNVIIFTFTYYKTS